MTDETKFYQVELIKYATVYVAISGDLDDDPVQFAKEHVEYSDTEYSVDAKLTTIGDTGMEDEATIHTLTRDQFEDVERYYKAVAEARSAAQ